MPGVCCWVWMMRFVKFRLGVGDGVSSFLCAFALEVDGGASNFPWISKAWTPDLGFFLDGDAYPRYGAGILLPTCRPSN